MPMTDLQFMAARQPISEIFETLITRNPVSCAWIAGSQDTKISGFLFCFDLWGGTLAALYMVGLPHSSEKCAPHFFGFHIHDGDVHYNPENCPHPAHAGDCPPLLSSNGTAWQMFYTGYFTPTDIIGKTAVIHEHADDFTSQPSGNSGNPIAKGEIREYGVK